MTEFLYPRIDSHEASRLITLVSDLTVEEAADRSLALMSEARLTFAAVGAQHVPDSHLKDLAAEVRRLAKASGYPSKRSLPDQQRFDTAVACWLHTNLKSVPGEARRAGTWQYLSCALLPDVVLWRWRKEPGRGEVSFDRFIGGRRNCFGRLWLRADVFRDPGFPDEWHLVRSLLEDNFTAILERGLVARYRTLCRAIATEYLARKETVLGLGDSPQQRLLRQLMLRVVRSSGNIGLGLLDPAGAKSLVAGLSVQTLNAMGLETPRPAAPSVGAIRLGKAPNSLPAEEGELGGTQRAVEPSGRTGGASRPTDFLTLSADAQIKAVWEAVIGEGALQIPDLVRIAAENLKRREQVSFERLREAGPLYRRVELILTSWGPRKGMFDSPSRGQRRAVATSLKQIPTWLWERLLRSVADADREVPPIQLVRTLQHAMGKMVGANPNAKSVLQVLNELREQGLLEERAGQMRAAPRLIETDPWWPGAT
jgi:hypothetical protein